MGNSNSVFFGRVGFVEISDPGGKNWTRYGSADGSLDFRFDVRKIGNLYNEFSVGIMGLSREVIGDLTTWENPKSFLNPRKVAVYAGYYDERKKNKGASLIAYGGIWNAYPSPPPNMWLTMKAAKYVGQHVPVEGKEALTGTLGGIMQQIAQIVGCRYNRGNSWKAKRVSEDAVHTFPVDGKRKDELVDAFARQFKVKVFADRDCAVGTRSEGSSNPDEREDVLFVVDRDGERDEGSPVETINVDSGLISLGSVDFGGLVANVRLDDGLQLHQWVRVESSLIPKANGSYYLIEKHHVGQLRGADWKTELRLLRRKN